MKDYLKEFNSLLQNLDRSKTVSTVFEDFLSLSTYALAQPFYRNKEFEKSHLDIVNRYKKEQAEKFSQMLALVVVALDDEYQDFLGKVFSLNCFGNARKGQFFTPYHVSKMMAKINCIELKEKIDQNNFITLSEPCCGSGGMIIAFAEAMREEGHNYQNQLFVEAIDIDETCFKMAYIQLSLLGIPARVMLGDSLAWKFQRVLYTPFYFVNGFELKLKQVQEKTEIKPIIMKTEQLKLFSMQYDIK